MRSGSACASQRGTRSRRGRVPSFNADRAASLASMEKVAHILLEKKAQLWINHDKPSSDARRHAPEFYE
jgi:N-acyl homoserine lactone hydrolase